jgi:CelD/BcsL family acetyltransferase involved in cellulose biosynthesis
MVALYQQTCSRLGRPPVVRELASEVRAAQTAKHTKASGDPTAELGKQFRDRADRAIRRIEAAMTEVTYSIRGMHHTDRDGFPGFITELTERLRKSGLPDLIHDDWWRPLLDHPDGSFDEGKTVHDQARLLQKRAKEADRGVRPRPTVRRRTGS